jgi:hypothetical protein
MSDITEVWRHDKATYLLKGSGLVQQTSRPTSVVRTILTKKGRERCLRFPFRLSPPESKYIHHGFFRHLLSECLELASGCILGAKESCSDILEIFINAIDKNLRSCTHKGVKIHDPLGHLPENGSCQTHRVPNLNMCRCCTEIALSLLRGVGKIESRLRFYVASGCCFRICSRFRQVKGSGA